jgi:hypothetical protein
MEGPIAALNIFSVISKESFREESGKSKAVTMPVIHMVAKYCAIHVINANN